LSLGEHRLFVRAEDTAGNVAQEQVMFTVEATIDALRAAVEQLVDAGEVAQETEQSLLAKVDAAAAAVARGNVEAAKGALRAFIAQINALEGKKVSPDAAAILVADAGAVREGLE
jgi:hypothetical protein